MARPRMPTNVLQLKGAFKKDPQRRRDAEPKPTGDIGRPPQVLNAAQKKIWKELVDNAAPGVLTNMDRVVLELACRVLDQIRTGDNVNASLVARLQGCLASMGMTPADRSKISLAGSADNKNAFDEF